MDEQKEFISRVAADIYARMVVAGIIDGSLKGTEQLAFFATAAWDAAEILWKHRFVFDGEEEKTA